MDVNRPTLVLACLAGLGASSAQADSRPTIHLGGFAGWNFVDEEIELGNSLYDDQVPESAFLLGARLGVDLFDLAPHTRIAPVLGFEIEGKVALSKVTGNAAVGRSDDDAPILGWRGHAMLSLFGNDWIHPFVLVGGGGETVATSSPYIDSPDTDAAFHWGAGARWDASPDVSARLDFRQIVTAGRYDYLALEHEIHVGLSYRFSLFGDERASRPAAPTDADGDGIVEGDRCPTEAEDRDGFEDADGCPDPDNDSDGIADADDACPDKAEDRDGFEDEDGCPDADNDLDFVLDEDDRCPLEAEDRDEFEDEDGCPDADNDADGIADGSDHCPLEPETKNQYQDADGCPDEIPVAIAKFTGTIKGIRFKSGSSRIMRSSERLLDQAVAVLKEYPDIRIEIAGHTDDTGSRMTNVILSRARAASVKKYLVGKGIADARIETAGHGPDQPIADNKTFAGRAENRRIEFHLIDGGSAATPADE